MTSRLIVQPCGIRLAVTDDAGQVLIGVYADGSPAYARLSPPDVVELVQALLATSPAARELIAAYSPGVTA